MATLEELSARLEKLKKARALGVHSVEYPDRRVQYKSDSEMAAAIAALEQDIAAAGGSRIVRTFRFTSDKDL